MSRDVGERKSHESAAQDAAKALGWDGLPGSRMEDDPPTIQMIGILVAIPKLAVLS
jgi:hypothetical protein